MLTGAYRDLLTAVAGAGAALTGLLFVALPVASPARRAGYPAVIRGVRAASSILAFTNVLPPQALAARRSSAMSWSLS